MTDPILRRIGRWKAWFLYGSLALLLLPGVVSLFILEIGLIPKAIHMVFPDQTPSKEYRGGP